MATKLNSMRLLDQHKVPYEVLEYPDSIHDALEVAEVLGVPYFSLFKTLVVEAVDEPSERKPYLVMISSERRLNLKMMARAVGIKKVRMASHKDAEALTGLKVGGISALALMDKHWKVFLDQEATALQHIVMSAGQRGYQLKVPVAPLVTILRARIVEVSEEEE